VMVMELMGFCDVIMVMQLARPCANNVHLAVRLQTELHQYLDHSVNDEVLVWLCQCCLNAPHLVFFTELLQH